MSLVQLVREVHRRDRLLSSVGWFHVALFAAMLAVAPFDGRIVTGLNPWIKPMKFAASIALYLWTLAWVLHHLPGSPLLLGAIRWGVSLAMVAEILCIGMQAARGTTSHYNDATAFDAAVFGVMGTMIFVNTLLVGLCFVLFLRRLPLQTAYLWGIRLGLLLFITGSLEGLVMVFNGAHTVGAPDGGPGLPLLNWSTRAGDLRAAHLVGLHSLQLLPLTGHILGRLRPRASRGVQITWMLGLALAYAAVGLWLYQLAQHGRPVTPA